MKHCNVARILIISALMILYATGYSQKHIAIIGSSSANGYFPASSGLPKDSAWAFKLKKYYQDLGIIDTIINLAQSSTTCFEGMPSSYTPPPGYPMPNPAINITKAVNLIPKPDVIIVNYPSNGYDWMPNEKIIECLQTIKDSANAQNIRCYISTTQPRDGFSPAERQKLKTLRDLILAQFGEFAIDFFTDIVQEPGLTIKTEYAIGDGVHLNPAGHTVLKNKVIEKNIFFVLVPVTFSALKATTQEGTVILRWNTYTESNNATFIIESSKDGIVFTPLGSIAGKLNAASLQQYSYKDLQPGAGKNYYRIVAVSTTGQKEFSNIVAVHVTKDRTNAFTASNSGETLTLQFSRVIAKPVEMNIYSLQGNRIVSHTINIAASLTHLINIAALPAGTYFAQAIIEGRKESVQFVKF